MRLRVLSSGKSIVPDNDNSYEAEDSSRALWESAEELVCLTPEQHDTLTNEVAALRAERDHALQMLVSMARNRDWYRDEIERIKPVADAAYGYMNGTVNTQDFEASLLTYRKATTDD